MRARIGVEIKSDFVKVYDQGGGVGYHMPVKNMLEGRSTLCVTRYIFLTLYIKTVNIVTRSRHFIQVCYSCTVRQIREMVNLLSFSFSIPLFRSVTFSAYKLLQLQCAVSSSLYSKTSISDYDDSTTITSSPDVEHRVCCLEKFPFSWF